MARARVLVVEDDESYQELYQHFFTRLHAAEFIGIPARTGKQALGLLNRHPSPPIDAAILDCGLPDTEGLTILKHIRSNPLTRDIVTFMITGNTRDKDADAALAARADDYITKPFRENALYLKLNNHLQRGRHALEERGAFVLDGLKLDVKGREVAVGGRPVHLQPKEFDFLSLLLERPNVVHARSFLADAVSTPSEPTSPAGVRQHMYALRRALGPWGARIEARYGQGYVLHTKSPASRS